MLPINDVVFGAGMERHAAARRGRRSFRLAVDRPARHQAGPDAQCEIIQGLAAGKDFAGLAAPVAVAFAVRLKPEQHEQPEACLPPPTRGDDALRSLVAKALRRSADIEVIRGALRIARGAGAAQSGQGCGIADSAMGRCSVKLPHPAQR